MATPLTLITQALKAAGILGVGQTALAEDYNDSFTVLRQMLAQWQKKRWLVPALQDVAQNGNNLISNTVGTGGYFNIPRPDKIQYAYARLFGNSAIVGGGDFNSDFNDDFSTGTGTGVVTTPANAVDYPLGMITSYENYAEITLKGLNSFPYVFFYDGAYPLSNLFVWPIPGPQYQIHIIVKVDISTLTTQVAEIILPPEYEEAIWTNLAIRLCVNYQVSASKELVALAKVSLNTIRNANTQISDLRMPAALSSGPWYNIYSDM